MSVHKIIRSHVIPALKTLPDEHVDTLMTSVPYFGLRDYGKDTATIWDGDESCKHDFFPSQIKHDNLRYRGAASDVRNEKKEEIHKGKENSSGAFCSKCGAWYGQLGLEPTPELYIKHLRMVFVEVKRILKKTGTCWVNIGDSYAGSSKGSGSSPDPKWEKARNDDMRHKTDWGGINLPAKCLCMIPERFLMMMVLDLGFILRNKNIWKKDNPMPSSVKNRFNNVWEPVYFFTKNNKPVYFYNDKSGAMIDKKPTSQIEGVDWGWKTCPFCDGTGVVKENEYTLAKWFEGELKMRFGEPCKRCKTTGKVKVNYWHSVDYWFDLDAVREPWTDTRPADIRRAEEGHKGYPGKYGSGYNAEYRDKLPGQGIKGQPVGNPNAGKNPGDFWSINTQPFPEAHFAVFPDKLCEKPILAGCPAEVCKHCGMARVRILGNGEKITSGGFGSKTADHVGLSPSSGIRSKTWNVYETIGWSDCQCEGEDKYQPGIILDPFGGSGTVSIEAEKLGRSSIYIDIKKDYCEMALKWLKPLAEQTKLTGATSKVIRIGF